MNKLNIQNLDLLITKKCNLNCVHCMRGKSSNLDMSDEVIQKTLQQISAIGNLAISGGEPLLALNALEKIFTYIIDNKILLDEYGVITNCTKDPKELIRLFDYFESYVNKTSRIKRDTKGSIVVSMDKYHLEQIKNFDQETQDKILQYIKDLSKSRYFDGFKGINKKLFAEGNAVNLPKEDTVSLRPMQTYICYAEKVKFLDRFKPIPKTGMCNVGPIVSISTDGTITETNSSYINQDELYNYGNVKDNSIEQVLLNRGAKVIRPNSWYRKTGKEIKKYSNYKK